MTKYIRPQCRPWCGSLSKPEWMDYKDLPGAKEFPLKNTFWTPGCAPFYGNIIQIWDSSICRDEKVCANTEENTMKEIWYVWKVGGGIPVQQQSSEQIAYKEAERLCNLHGGEFIVCKAVASCIKSPLIWKNFDETVPF